MPGRNDLQDIIESGAFALQPSPTAPAIANAGTIASHELGITRVTPAAAVTGIILAPGDYDGQFCTVQNKGAFGSSITFDVAATSNMLAGVNEIIPGGASKDYKYDLGAARWHGIAGVLPVPALAPHAGVLATADTLVIPAAAYSKISCAPAGAVTGIIFPLGVLDGQEVTLVNTSAFAITPAAAGTSHVADGAQAIAALTSRTFIWDVATQLWSREA